MVLDLNVEGAWAAEEVVDGDQIVFGRVRIRDTAIADGECRVTHPHGVDKFVADGKGIDYVRDIGIEAAPRTRCGLGRPAAGGAPAAFRVVTDIVNRRASASQNNCATPERPIACGQQPPRVRGVPRWQGPRGRSL